MRINVDNIFKFDFKIKEGATIFKNNNGLYLKNDSKIHELNETGAIIFSALKQNNSIREIIDLLATTFEIPSEKITLDILYFLKGIYQNKVLSIYYNRININVPSWEIDALQTVQVIVTHNCNIRCCHCLIPEYNNQFLTLPDYEAIFRQLYALGNEFINFSGGELFTRNDIFDIFENAVGAGIDYGFNTNGTLIDLAKVNKLKENPPKDISVSLYGHNKKLHELVTKAEGSFAKTVNAIKLFLTAGFNLTIKTMVTKFNINQVEKIAEFSENLGVENIVFDSTIFRKNDGSSTPLQYRATEEDLYKFENSKFGKELEFKPREYDSLICNAGVTRIAIDTDGTVYPCSIFRLPIGNLKKQKLKSILDDSDEFNKYLQFRVKHLPGECLNCEGVNFCKICPGLSYNEHKDYRQRYDFECMRTKAKIDGKKTIDRQQLR
ncbi:MAG: hypothetical protein A3H23_02885 [Planctomycetes bacterium RIFCSPLOWO2_12_FULL_40_19]|nr:MAG: hypothetical protein A3H23_02885 [Planctomycetes bacterium RIFCSPLOWO2_12_FULL_40_19]